jgi:hypothetical protein
VFRVFESAFFRAIPGDFVTDFWGAGTILAGLISALLAELTPMTAKASIGSKTDVVDLNFNINLRRYRNILLSANQEYSCQKPSF